MLLSACVLTTPLALGGKHRNTVTKAHTELNPHHNQRAFYAHKLHGLFIASAFVREQSQYVCFYYYNCDVFHNCSILLLLTATVLHHCKCNVMKYTHHKYTRNLGKLIFTKSLHFFIYFWFYSFTEVGYTRSKASFIL